MARVDEKCINPEYDCFRPQKKNGGILRARGAAQLWHAELNEYINDHT